MRHPEALEYVLPLRWEGDEGLAELTAYLRRLSQWVDVTVVDGSPPARFAAHERMWGFVRHVAPARPGANGKARGAMTGIDLSRHDRVVIADDDVRYERAELLRVAALLEGAEFVRPQNVFRPLPWHARWDTGRSLVNRALGGDFSGTVALRRSALRGQGYDTDVLFENLELERTVQAHGGRVVVARDLHVERRPPTVRRFFEQRVRQAYDDFAQPGRLVRELAALPLFVMAARSGRWRAVVAGAVAIVALAEFGRRRAGGAAVFGPTAALWAPLWLAERAVTVWIAVALRLRGGVRYRDARLARAANPLRRLKRAAAHVEGGMKEESYGRAA
ncbi:MULTISPECIES: glycosyltransferase family 2 protein [Microbacterium]|uniref:glycosyltransferase n=1 Tax=Microbacterium TaxID=33882 RepID=UPI000D653ECD|nr:MULTISPECIES: glycosyltransferase family 2 protein [Microbacterium]